MYKSILTHLWFINSVQLEGPNTKTNNQQTRISFIDFRLKKLFYNPKQKI